MGTFLSSQLSTEFARSTVAALADIIKSKRAAGRARDLAVLDVLEKTLGEESSQERRSWKLSTPLQFSKEADWVSNVVSIATA
jgi:hypothetical protein